MPTRRLNQRSGSPLWRQIADAIAADIRSGELQVGDAAPSSRELSATWGVAPTTAMAALTELRQRGILSEARGQASRVLRAPAMHRRADRYRQADAGQSPAHADFDASGDKVTITGHVRRTTAPRAIASRLNLTEGDPVTRVDYCWSDAHGPVQRSTQWEPLAITRGTSAEQPPENGEPDVITRMAAIGYTVTLVRENIGARMPSADEADELDLGEGLPLVAIERTHYAENTPIETADIAVRSDKAVIVSDHHIN